MGEEDYTIKQGKKSKRRKADKISIILPLLYLFL